MSTQSRGHNGENNGMHSMDPGQPVIDVAPLRSVPYTGPLPTSNHDASQSGPNAASFPTENAQSSANASSPQPAMIYSTVATHEERANLFAATCGHTKVATLLTGTAVMGKVGSPIGAVDIFESDTEYLFRVSLPGVAKDPENFHCNIEPDGKVEIKGITLTGVRAVYKHNMVFKMNTPNLCPPGKFTISFQLPGPTANKFLSTFNDGIFEASVKKRVPTNF